MTIFDKISGFAQKAKENALSRAVLAKDKRLDKSMSESIEAAHIGLLKMATFGVSGTVSAVAFDPVAGLLAVGGGFEQDTFIRLFGRGISAELVLNNPTRIKYLQFKIGYPILVAVDMKNVITTYDLKTKRAKHVVTTPSIITALEYCAGTDWLFVGFADGNVDVFDITKGRFSEEYGIPDLLLEDATRSNQEPPSSTTKTSSLVVALQMHPTDLSMILIGYESAVYLWNIREQTIKKRFSIQQPSQLTCLAWSPCGNRFMAGYDDGYMRLWDTRSDHKPVLTRRAFHASPSTSPSTDPCEPIYRMVWYVDDTSKRSFLVVAGGSDLPDIRGLHIMEFDIESDQRDARRQTILTTSVDVSDFILLSRDPFFLGMNNPLGLLVVGCDGAIRAYGLGHGYPQLTLPSALQFLDPPVSNAYHFTQLPESTFQRIIAMDQINMPPTHYLPLTGGVAGTGHVYRLDSNDLLITIHAHRIIHIWDASYTALRPLTHLTIDCIEDIQKDPKAKIIKVDFDTQSASLFVALDNGTVLQYTHHPPRDSQHQLSQTTQEAFIRNCDNTIEEISELLKDMETEEPVNAGKDDEQHIAATDESSNNDNIAQQPPAATTTEDTAQEQPQQESESSSSSPPPPHVPESIKTPTPDIQLLEGDINPPCFAPAMRIKFTASVKQLVAAGGDMLAVATADGKMYVINTLFGRTVYTADIQAETEHQEEVSKEEDNEEHNQKQKQLSTASISCIRFYRTYASLESTEPCLQLFVGLDNGLVYQHDISSPYKPPILISNNSTSAVIDTHVFDIHGVLQTATKAEEATPSYLEPKEQQESQAMESHPSTSTTSPEEESLAAGRKSHESGASLSKDEDGASSKSEKSSGSMGLLRRTTRKLSKSSARANKDPPPPPPPLPTEDASPPSASTVESQSAEAPTTQHTKRAPHASKWEYRPQPHPHFIVVSTSRNIATVLSGYNIRLFTAHLHDIDGCSNEDMIIHSQVMMVKKVGACLAVVLQSGAIIYYSLPHLLPIARISLPNELAARDLLDNMSLSTDGRIVAWTGLCELEQYLSLLQNSITCGEDVMLFDPSRRIPPHPTAVITTQKPKKSWLESVQGAFQKGPFTVAELDTLMGKRPILGAPSKAKSTEDQQRTSNAEGSGSGGGGVGGVFQELSQKMNERGEKLDQLQNKFEDMSAQSGDFLKAVREYNERQARKKWWEF